MVTWELSARGRELGERRKAVDVVYASDLRRAAQTVEIAFAGSGKEIGLDRGLRKCDHGIYNGRPVSEVAALRGRHIDMPWPGGAELSAGCGGDGGVLREVMEEWQGGLVLVVSRSANRWAVQNLLDGLRWRSCLTRRSSGGRGGNPASPEVGRVGCPPRGGVFPVRGVAAESGSQRMGWSPGQMVLGVGA
ncbi:histidine phosphatase family protein [Nonomuraea jabiensis]|uniref:histidine phosphatase family protein n=1 Tax=Nonomuraea jabiensis TaxID=882448 RepID=UPI003426FAF1